MVMCKMLSRVGILFMIFAATTVAQISTGTISGTVKDDTGAVVPGANVVVLDVDTGISRSLQTDSNGFYSAPSLALGNYRVTASKEGMQTEVREGITLTVGREAVVDITVRVGSVSQTVSVTAEAPLVESTTATLGSLVDDRTIRTLPLNGRSYDQLALLQPGVILDSPGPANTSLFYGTGRRFSVGGQRTVSNVFLLDGTNINDQGNGTPGGATGSVLGVDTIKEFKILTNGFEAEYGHSTGSVITAVTRSGTNELHGTGFEYIRNSALDTRNYFDVFPYVPPFKRNQFGGVLGGPIKKDKTFFFGGYEGLRQGQGTSLTAIVPTAQARAGILPTGTVAVNPAVVPLLNLYPLPNATSFGDGTAEYISSPNIITNENNAMVRVDHQLNTKTSLFARYGFDQDYLNSPQSLPVEVQVSGSRRQYSTVQATTVLQSDAVNNVRFAFNRTYTHYDQLTTPDPGPQVSIVAGQPLGSYQIGAIGTAGSRAVTPLGTTSGQGNSIFAYNVLEWADDFSYIKGKHSFKVGTDIQRLQDNYSNNTQVRGTYTFSTFATFLTGVPSNLTVSTPLGLNAYWGARQTLLAFYGQDSYRVNSRLTLDLGLRWEAPTDPIDVNGKMSILPSPAATATVVSSSFITIAKKNFEPRVGLAWQLNDSGKTVLRAGAGIYHNQILPWDYQFETRLPPFYATLSANNPPFPNGAQAAALGGKVVPSVMVPFEKTPVDDQYNLSIQQQILKNTVFQIAYAGNRASHLETETEADTPVPVICSTSSNNCPAGLPNGIQYYPANAPRRNPTWNGIRLYDNNGPSQYDSVTVTMRTQTSTGFEGQIFYTYAKAMDLASSVATSDTVRAPIQIMDPDYPQLDWGLSELDTRHTLIFNFSYPVPLHASSKVMGALANNWAIDGIGTFTTGMPFTVTLASNQSRNQSSVLADRPNLVSGASPNPTHGVSAGCSGLAAGTPLGTATHFYDACAFSLPAAGTYGNLGRDTLEGAGVQDVDLALEKKFAVRERMGVTFRAEVFNLTNHTNLGLPNTTALTATGTANPQAGLITYTTTSSRQIQFGLRISF
jgi:outer membrane receptor protein involved in Fe transport